MGKKKKVKPVLTFIKPDGTEAKKQSKNTAVFSILEQSDMRTVECLPPATALTQEQADALWQLAQEKLDERIVPVGRFARKKRAELYEVEAEIDEAACAFVFADDLQYTGIVDNKSDVAAVFNDWANISASTAVEKGEKKQEKKQKKRIAKIEKQVEDNPLDLDKDDLAAWTIAEIENNAG